MKIAAGDLRIVTKALEKHGILLQTDAALPNVVSLLAAEQIRGSWWTHPLAQKIFAGLNKLQDHEDILFTKLISGKITLVHRRLWRDFLSIATARQAWQKRGLSPAARFLLRAVDQKQIVRTNEIEWPKRLQPAKIGVAAGELETRLLIHAEEFHTKSGMHAKLLEAWSSWSEHVSFTDEFHSAVLAKRVFEKLLVRLNKEHDGKGRLPWISSGT